MNTTIYLIRHSTRLCNDNIEEYNSSQEKLIKSEKIILNVDGEKRAERLSRESELQNLDIIYTSNCVRTLQTAKYIMEAQNLKAHIDDRFDERRVGIPNDDVVPDWKVRQYIDENYKTIGGESQVDVRERFGKAVYEVLEKNKNKRIAIFCHGIAMVFFMLKWCKLEHFDEEDNMILTFKGKEIFNGKMNAPEVFKLEFDEDNEIIDITNIKFEDIEFKDGLGK